jgi:hypothetical protein
MNSVLAKQLGLSTDKESVLLRRRGFLTRPAMRARIASRSMSSRVKLIGVFCRNAAWGSGNGVAEVAEIRKVIRDAPPGW